MERKLGGHPLDNPVWFALNSVQAEMATGGALAKRFPSDISPFAASVSNEPEAVAALGEIIPPGGQVCVMQRDVPAPGDGVAVTFSARGVQMVAEAIRAQGLPDFQMVELGQADAAEMYDLATLTKPGPYLPRTNTMGRFLGIREGGALVAMAGERLMSEGYCEISAVCTHPDFRGRGFGGALLSAVGERLLAEGVTPFLHAYADNAAAIGLYEKLGFVRRCGVIQELWERADA